MGSSKNTNEKERHLEKHGKTNRNGLENLNGNNEIYYASGLSLVKALRTKLAGNLFLSYTMLIWPNTAETSVYSRLKLDSPLLI